MLNKTYFDKLLANPANGKWGIRAVTTSASLGLNHELWNYNETNKYFNQEISVHGCFFFPPFAVIAIMFRK